MLLLRIRQSALVTVTDSALRCLNPKVYDKLACWKLEIISCACPTSCNLFLVLRMRMPFANSKSKFGFSVLVSYRNPYPSITAYPAFKSTRLK